MIAAAVLLVVAAQAPAPSGRIPVDAVAAVIERRVVTTSEVDAEARLVLLEKAGPEIAAGPIDDKLRAVVLDTIVAQELLALQARRTGVTVRETDIDKLLVAQRERFPDAEKARAFFLRVGADEELLRGRARRDLAVQALLSRSFAEVKLSDDEVAAFAKVHPELDVARAREELVRERRERIFRALLERTRKDVDVRVIWKAPASP
jgi:hypothetical protein